MGCVHEDLGWFLNSLLKPPTITTNVTAPSTRQLALLILSTVLRGRDDRYSIHFTIRETEAQRGKDLPIDWDTMILSLSQKEKRVNKCSAPFLLILPSNLLVPAWKVLQNGMNPGAFKHKVSEDSFSLLLLLNLEKAFRIMPLGNDSLQSSAPGIKWCVQKMSFSPMILMAKPHSRPNQRLTGRETEVWSLGFYSAVWAKRSWLSFQLLKQ